MLISQISENVTAFFGGSVNNFGVVTYDWSIMNYTSYPIQLLSPRVGSGCVLIKDKSGLPKVAIVGGINKGMEFWNPADGTVESVNEQIPPEEGATMGMEYPSILPIKDGEEFLVYGGFKGSIHKGIWKYTVADNSWIRIGSTLIPKAEHVALAVSGIDCSVF